MTVARALSLFALAMVVPGCGPGDAPAPSSSASTAPAPSTTHWATASVAPVASADAPPANALEAMRRAILACPYSEGAFPKCAAADALRTSTDSYLTTGPAGQKLLEMLVGPDEKDAAIATLRPPTQQPMVKLDQTAGQLLTATLSRPNVAASVRAGTVQWLGYVDLEATHLTETVKTIAKNSDPEVRRALAYGLFWGGNTAQVRFDLETELLADADKTVRSAAATALSNQSGSGNQKACDALAKGLAVETEASDDLVWGASNAGSCKGLLEKALARMKARSQDPAKLTASSAMIYASSCEAICRKASSSPAARASSWDVSLLLGGPKNPEPRSRTEAFNALARCDPDKAKLEISKYTNDKDTVVAEGARSTLVGISGPSK